MMDDLNKHIEEAQKNANDIQKAIDHAYTRLSQQRGTIEYLQSSITYDLPQRLIDEVRIFAVGMHTITAYLEKQPSEYLERKQVFSGRVRNLSVISG